MSVGEAVFLILICAFAWSVYSLVSAIENYQELKRTYGLTKKGFKSSDRTFSK